GRKAPFLPIISNTNLLSRTGHNQRVLCAKHVLPPNPSQILREISFASSVTDNACGPLKNVRNSFKATVGLGLSGSMRKHELTAACRRWPRSHSGRGKTPRKPVILPLSSSCTRDRIESCCHGWFRKT